MKKIYILSAIIMVVLAVAITYLGLQRDHIFNPPVITGVGFLVIAIVFMVAGNKK
ncbi:hypothetical protein [Winogradskyella sp.]|uniref:hypothetical protein n=1 Tax=Winogradskyella sp. TaxID=1883156 RepID=UPI002619AF55|nr:hypothetical protein [Winogradskyella sp.]